MTNQPAGPFTRDLWETNKSLIEEIIHHPFCRKMSDGTLSQEAFAHYLAQDVLYIEQDARAFAITAGRANTNDAFSFFIDMARDGLEIERILHKELLPFFKIKQIEEMSAACKRYTSFLLNTALNDSYPESVAALLPCFWVYRETGLKIRTEAVENNSFRKWINTYSDEVYGLYVDHFIRITENLMSGASLSMRKKMNEAFCKSCECEKAFFSEAMDKEKR